ncbi:MAG: endonuclease domain-containing protein [Sphingomicrobium sp.]
MKRVDETLTRDARDLRNNATHAERVLWRLLSRYRPRFTRQLVVSSYIVDLACREAKVAIEVDGGQHGKTLVYDARRTAFLQNEGWLVLRLWNNEVLGNPEAAADFILTQCAERLGGAHPQPLPFREGRVRKPRSRNNSPP